MGSRGSAGGTTKKQGRGRNEADDVCCLHATKPRAANNMDQCRWGLARSCEKRQALELQSKVRLYEDATATLLRSVSGLFVVSSPAIVRGCRTPLCYGAFRACWSFFTSLLRLYEHAARHFVTECFGPVGKTRNICLTTLG